MKRAMLLASGTGAAGPWGLTAEGWWLGGQRILSHQEKGPKQRGNTKGTATLLGTGVPKRGPRFPLFAKFRVCRAIT